MRRWLLIGLILTTVTALLAACGVVQDVSQGVNSAVDNLAESAAITLKTTFTVEATGAVRLSMPPGTVALTMPEPQGTVPDHYALTFTSDQDGASVILEFPLDIQPGDYAITSDLFVTGEVAARLEFASGEPFNQNVTGTLTVDTMTDALSGSFEFSAGEHESPDKIVTVKGTFAGVTLKAEG